MAAQIVVVDDDPIVGTLTLELLQEAGFEAVWVQDSLKAQERIKAEKPALVILDILMPGLDGLTLLHRLKSDPETAKLRAVVVSGKSFEAERQRALQYGAEAFIEKPYDVESFGKQIGELMARSGQAPRAPAGAPAVPAPEIRPKTKAVVWGFRSRATARTPLASKYGKATPCVTVESGKNLFIFDAGSGLAALGPELARSGRKEAWLFLTSFAPERTEGLPGLPALRDAGFTLNVSAASEPDRPLDQALAEILAGPGAAAPQARLELYELIEQTYEIMPGVRLTAYYANHPGTSMGFLLQAEGKKIAYLPASELYGEFATALQDYDEKLGGLVRGADLLFHDGRYTEDDYRANRNKGHTCFLAAVEFAGRNRIKELVLMHQDDAYGDETLDAMQAAADARVAEKKYPLTVRVAREGLTLTL